MTEMSAYLIGVAATLMLCGCAVCWLHARLLALLLDLCGSRERARFWTAFSNLTLLLTPLIFALNIEPELRYGRPSFFAVATQLKWGLIGMLCALLTIGLTLASFIHRTSSAAVGRTPGGKS